MKHLRKFNEAIIDYAHSGLEDFLNILRDEVSRKRMLDIDQVNELGGEYNIEVVDYDTFFSNLSEHDKKTAPPKGDPRSPIFGLPHNDKIILVMQIPFLDMRILPMVNHILKHENIHRGQYKRSALDVILPNPNDKVSYFSDKNEIMAFSHSITDLLINMEGCKNMEECINKLPNNPLYKDIKKNVDEKTLNRYKKYIYLYIEMELSKNK